VTYDEALSELFEHVVPLHEELGIPGHVEVVVGHIGSVRQIGQSSYNGYRHMDAGELRQLIALGWGVGNHSWSHGNVAENPDLEIRVAREVLEEAIGERVVVYCSPGNNANMPPAIEPAKAAGYLCALSITDDINRPDCDLWWLNRTPNLHKHYEPFFSAFDPHHRVRQAQEHEGWIIDYCHCPAPRIPHESKDVYLHEHRERLETILTEGDEGVWCVTVEEAVDYILTRRHTRLEVVAENDREQRYCLYLKGLPSQVACRQLTLEMEVPSGAQRAPEILVGGQVVFPTLVRPRCLRFTVDVTDGLEISRMRYERSSVMFTHA
jgi:peptidoglycan/xylan/chitin deacetylase (PgdA/CDA1 family)